MSVRGAWIASMWACGVLAQGCVAGGAEPPRLELEALAFVNDVDSVRPVVLVAGLMQDEATVAPLAEAFRSQGLDVTVWVPANSGLDDINGYAEQLGLTVTEVLERTRATRVDLVGHSEGGLTSRRYVQDRGDGAPVHTLIALGSPQQGTEGGLLSQLLRIVGCETWSTACQQMVAGSSFLEEINGDEPTPGDVRYVSVGTEYDGVVQPVSRAAIPGGENVVMQAVCPERVVGHFGLLEDAWVHEVVLEVLAGRAASGDCDAQPVGSWL